MKVRMTESQLRNIIKRLQEAIDNPNTPNMEVAVTSDKLAQNGNDLKKTLGVMSGEARKSGNGNVTFTADQEILKQSGVPTYEQRIYKKSQLKEARRNKLNRNAISFRKGDLK